MFNVEKGKTRSGEFKPDVEKSNGGSANVNDVTLIWHGSETWILSKPQRRHGEAFEMCV